MGSILIEGGFLMTDGRRRRRKGHQGWVSSVVRHCPSPRTLPTTQQTTLSTRENGRRRIWYLVLSSCWHKRFEPWPWSLISSGWGRSLKCAFHRRIGWSPDGVCTVWNSDDVVPTRQRASLSIVKIPSLAAPWAGLEKQPLATERPNRVRLQHSHVSKNSTARLRLGIESTT